MATPRQRLSRGWVMIDILLVARCSLSPILRLRAERSITNLDAVMYQILYQSKLLVTAVLSVLFLSRCVNSRPPPPPSPAVVSRAPHGVGCHACSRQQSRGWRRLCAQETVDAAVALAVRPHVGHRGGESLHGQGHIARGRGLQAERHARIRRGAEPACCTAPGGDSALVPRDNDMLGARCTGCR